MPGPALSKGLLLAQSGNVVFLHPRSLTNHERKEDRLKSGDHPFLELDEIPIPTCRTAVLSTSSPPQIELIAKIEGMKVTACLLMSHFNQLQGNVGPLNLSTTQISCHFRFL